MSTRLNIPELGIDQIIGPRASREDLAQPVTIEPDDPTNIPQPDLDVDLIDLPDETGSGDRDEEAENLDVNTFRELPKPGEPLEPGHYEQFDVADDISLDLDPNASMVESVFLHLLSEHDLYEALHLSEQDAFALHGRLHAEAREQSLDLGHRDEDLRFRPAMALAAAMLCTDHAHH